MKATISMLDAISRMNQLNERIDLLKHEMKGKTNALALSNATLDSLISESITKQDLIHDFTELKSKINESNAATKIVIGNKEYTIADALARIRILKTERRIVKYYKEQLVLLYNSGIDSEELKKYQIELARLNDWESDIINFETNLSMSMIKSNASTIITCDLTTI